MARRLYIYQAQHPPLYINLCAKKQMMAESPSLIGDMFYGSITNNTFKILRFYFYYTTT
jgi:hypothetical protein